MANRFYKHKIENLIVVPKIVTIHYLELNKNFAYEGESHDFWELVYADKNEIVCTVENEKFVLPEGGLIFHKPNEFHALAAVKNRPPNVFIITFECASEAMKLFENKMLTLPPEYKFFIHNIIKEAKQTFTMSKQNPFVRKMETLPSPALGGGQLIRLNLEQLLISLLRHSNKKQISNVFVNRDTFENSLINEIIGFLKSNIYANITISDICKKTNYGKSYLYNLFKSQTGNTIKNYYINLKIEAAKNLIRQETSSLSEISDRLSFSSISYFCRVFQKITSMTPTQYAKSVNTSQQAALY